MKTAIAIFAIALGASLPLQAASASDKSAALTTAVQGHDLSAAKKKKRSTVNVYPAYYGYYPVYARAYPDPSWQSPELRRLRSLNRCVVDLGYGRWENCD